MGLEVILFLSFRYLPPGCQQVCLLLRLRMYVIITNVLDFMHSDDALEVLLHFL